MTYNTVSWFQIGTEDPAETKRFYGDLFGWTFSPDPTSDGRYDVIAYPGAETPSGGIADVRDSETGKHAIFFVLVEDVPAAVARTEHLGGKLLTPVTTSPTGLVFAHLLDPTGNHFGIFTAPTT